MPLYTGIFQVGDSTEILQASASNEQAALGELIGRLPYDDGDELSENDETMLCDIASGDLRSELTPVGGRRNVWIWLAGLRLDAPIDAYVIKTDEN